MKSWLPVLLIAGLLVFPTSLTWARSSSEQTNPSEFNGMHPEGNRYLQFEGPLSIDPYRTNTAIPSSDHSISEQDTPSSEEIDVPTAESDLEDNHGEEESEYNTEIEEDSGYLHLIIGQTLFGFIGGYSIGNYIFTEQQDQKYRYLLGVGLGGIGMGLSIWLADEVSYNQATYINSGMAWGTILGFIAGMLITDKYKFYEDLSGAFTTSFALGAVSISLAAITSLSWDIDETALILINSGGAWGGLFGLILSSASAYDTPARLASFIGGSVIGLTAMTFLFPYLDISFEQSILMNVGGVISSLYGLGIPYVSGLDLNTSYLIAGGAALLGIGLTYWLTYDWIEEDTEARSGRGELIIFQSLTAIGLGALLPYGLDTEEKRKYMYISMMAMAPVGFLIPYFSTLDNPITLEQGLYINSATWWAAYNGALVSLIIDNDIQQFSWTVIGSSILGSVTGGVFSMYYQPQLGDLSMMNSAGFWGGLLGLYIGLSFKYGEEALFPEKYKDQRILYISVLSSMDVLLLTSVLLFSVLDFSRDDVLFVDLTILASQLIPVATLWMDEHFLTGPVGIAGTLFGGAIGILALYLWGDDEEEISHEEEISIQPGLIYYRDAPYLSVTIQF